MFKNLFFIGFISLLIAGVAHGHEMLVAGSADGAKLVAAKRAWPPFWTRFGNAVRHQDTQSLKSMMVVKYLDCGIADESNSLDLRERCISDWKAGENNYSGLDPDDLSKLVSSKSICRVTRGDGLGWEFVRNVSLFDCEHEEGKGARFVYQHGNWFLQAFKVWEGA